MKQLVTYPGSTESEQELDSKITIIPTLKLHGGRTGNSLSSHPWTTPQLDSEQNGTFSLHLIEQEKEVLHLCYRLIIFESFV